MRNALLSTSLAWLILLFAGCGQAASGSAQSSGQTTTTGSGSGGGGTGGESGDCSVSLDAAALACSALDQLHGPGLSASFEAGVLVEVQPDGATIDAGPAGEVKFHWSGDDLTTRFAVGDAVTPIEEGFSSRGYTGIESTKARAVVAYSLSNTSVSPPETLARIPQLAFAFAPECTFQSCAKPCIDQLVTTNRLSLVINAGPMQVTLKTGETATALGVVVHHGGATEASAPESGSSTCHLDFVNEGVFTLLQPLP